MEKIEYNGEIYYYNGKQFTDEYFIVVNDTLGQELAKVYFEKVSKQSWTESKVTAACPQ